MGHISDRKAIRQENRADFLDTLFIPLHLHHLMPLPLVTTATTTSVTEEHVPLQNSVSCLPETVWLVLLQKNVWMVS